MGFSNPMQQPTRKRQTTDVFNDRSRAIFAQGWHFDLSSDRATRDVHAHGGAFMTDGRPPEVRRFGPFRFDVRDQRLFRDSTEIELRRKPFVILRYLTAHPQRLVTRDELVEAVWGKNIAISESLLRTHLSHVRRALGEGVLETAVGRGYRFLLAVETETPEPKAQNV